MVELMFEVRWHGMPAQLMDTVIGGLIARGLLRGPLSQSVVYELTAAGWDACAASLGRA